MTPGQFRKLVHEDNIVAAIRDAECLTSGEIRVFISHKKVDDAVSAARTAFVEMGMTKTRERNGVLIFVAPRTHRFAVIGDEGIHKHCGDEFWRQLVGEMSDQFKSSRFTDGINHAVRKAGESLARHFPRRPDDRNELPNAVGRD